MVAGVFWWSNHGFRMVKIVFENGSGTISWESIDFVLLLPVADPQFVFYVFLSSRFLLNVAAVFPAANQKQHFQQRNRSNIFSTAKREAFFAAAKVEAFCSN